MGICVVCAFELVWRDGGSLLAEGLDDIAAEEAAEEAEEAFQVEGLPSEGLK